MAVVNFLHLKNPSTWAGVEPATLGTEGQRQTNHVTQPTWACDYILVFSIISSIPDISGSVTILRVGIFEGLEEGLFSELSPTSSCELPVYDGQQRLSVDVQDGMERELLLTAPKPRNYGIRE
ncbi:uncharacterized protein TNCV_5118451 [Trichonephila clavipes]|nr:uncharacterized protein TNCV_5118451 [Trichonephila clavipes]